MTNTMFDSNSPQYKQWNGMRHRCQLGGQVQRKQPTYLGCEMDETWHSFDEYLLWAKNQIGFSAVDEFGNLFAIDKDLLLIGNKIYSPDNCVFIPPAINQFISIGKRSASGLPIGVYLEKNKKSFRSRISNGNKNISLGYFKDVNSAFNAYRLAKINHANTLINKFKGFVDDRVLAALSKYDIDMNGNRIG